MNKIKFILLMAVLFCSGMATAQSGAIVTGKVTPTMSRMVLLVLR